MPTSGGRRRSARQVPLSRQTRPSAAISPPPPIVHSLAPRGSAGRDERPVYRYWCVVGDSWQFDFRDGRVPFSPDSDAHRNLAALGQAGVFPALITCEGVSRPVFFVTSPIDWERKLQDFRAWFSSLHPKSVDWTHFPNVFAPEKYWGGPEQARRLGQDVWHSLEDGVMWTLDLELARKVAARVNAFASRNRLGPPAFDQCPTCYGKDLEYGYQARGPLGHDFLTVKSCRRCRQIIDRQY